MSLQRTLFYKYDPNTTSFVYGKFLDPVKVVGFLATSGSSATTTALETSGLGSTPFDVAAVGDVLLSVDAVGAGTYRTITAKASSTSVTVDTAWTLGAAGKAVKLLPFKSGDLNFADGWVFTGNFQEKTIKINILAITGTSVDITIDGKMSDTDATAYAIFTKSYTATGSDIFTISEDWSFLRVGLKETGPQAGVNSVSVYLTLTDVVDL